MSTEYKIYRPPEDEAAEYADFRKATFVEQACKAGIPRLAIDAHVEDWGSSNASDVEAWSGILASGVEGEKHILGLRADGVVSGIFIAHWNSPLKQCMGDSYVELIQISETCRGHGIGTMLMETFLRKTDQPVWLDVHRKDERAQSFCRYFGFIEQSSHVQRIGSEKVDTILMKREKREGETDEI